MTTLNKAMLACTAALTSLSTAYAAASFEAYGVVNTGLVVRNAPDASGESKTNLSMGSGIMMGNRVGVRGREMISDGLTVSFVLEGGFDSDTGQLYSYGGDRSRIFGREAQVSLETDWGTVSFGRVGNFFSGNGTYGI